MAHEYCMCDDQSAIGNYTCDCSGLTYCTCDNYTGGGPYHHKINNFTKEGCPSLIFTPPNTYNTSDINILYNLLDSKIKSGKIIYGDDIESLWDEFLSLVNTKKNENYAGYSLSYNYSKPTDVSKNHVIKADHFEYLKKNIRSVHTNAPGLIDDTGDGFKTPDNVIIRSTTDADTTEYDPGSVIFANEVAKLAKWIGASMYQCVCDHNVQVICCPCNMVCDCNY